METKPSSPTLLREHAEKFFLPGAMLMKYGPENYVGAALAVRATLYFKGGHTAVVREAICECFKDYEALACEHLHWLFREDPPEGPTKMAYGKAPPLQDMMKRMKEDDLLSFAYTGGKKSEDASPWLFYAKAMRGWKAKIGTWGLDCLEFSFPLLYVEENPKAFQQMFLNFARRLVVEHGHAGFAFNLSLTKKEANEATEAFMASKMNGIDVGTNQVIAGRERIGIRDHIKTIGWLTAINSDMLAKVGGILTLRSELPMDWFALYEYGNGIILQAGPRPDLASVEIDPKPATYVLPNMALLDIRVPEIRGLHYGSKDGEPRLFGAAAEQWLTRFDVPEAELLNYKAELLSEPKLTNETTLANRL
jgi:hypothetical protein